MPEALAPVLSVDPRFAGINRVPQVRTLDRPFRAQVTGPVAVPSYCLSHHALSFLRGLVFMASRDLPISAHYDLDSRPLSTLPSTRLANTLLASYPGSFPL